MLCTRSGRGVWQSGLSWWLSRPHLCVIFRATLGLLATSALFAQGRMSQEELVVRSAYASVVLASRVGSIANSPTWDLVEPPLAIRIEAVQTGRMAELLDERLSDHVTIPSAPTLLTSSGTWSYNEQHLATIVQVGDWGPANPSDGETDQGLRRITFRDVLEGTGWNPSTWASFPVVLSAHGRERRYHAMFLFENGEAGGPPKVRMIDYILGASTLDAVMHSNLAKDVLALPGRIRDLCASAAKTSAHATPADAIAYGRTKSIGADMLLQSLKVTPDCVADSATGLCCDSGTGDCGLRR